MKINFDDISYEEFDDNILNNIHIKQNDILLPQIITYWFNNKWKNYNIYLSIYNIHKIQLSNNITKNPYSQFNDIFEKIPNNEIMFSIKGHWYWFKYDQNLKIK